MTGIAITISCVVGVLVGIWIQLVHIESYLELIAINIHDIAEVTDENVG